jgi:TPR repeat protein
VGVPQDDVEAYKWLNLAAAQDVNLAAAQDDEVAIKERKSLADRMTKEQIAEAQRLSSEFRPKPNPESN